MSSYYQGVFSPYIKKSSQKKSGTKKGKKKKYSSSREFYILIVVILSSIGILLCVLLFSWLTEDTRTWTSKYTYFEPLHPINTAKMSGNVILTDVENPLKGGIVTVSHRFAIVNSEGFFNLLPVKPGIYDMKISYNNLELYKESITLKEGANEDNVSVRAIVPGFMARLIPGGTPDEKIFKPVTPAVYRSGNPDLKRVAFTIDDGWIEHNSLLNLFKSYGIRCTVFILGGRGIADGRPEWVKKMDDMGFEVCNHTMDHEIITNLSDEKLEKNIRDAQKNITRVTKKVYPYFRPPFGEYDKRTLNVLARNGFKIILWSNSIKDTYTGATPEFQVSHVLKNLKNGDIILSHFGAYNTYTVIKELIPKILEKGFEIVTVSEVLEGLE